MATTDGRPVLTVLNNDTLTSRNAMPLKNLTSDNNSSFSLTRRLFNRSYLPNPVFNTAPVGRSFVQRDTPGIQHGFIIDGPKSVLQKKWIGGNRDASQIAERRRKNTTGAFMTFPGAKSFNNPNDRNPRIEALARVRGGGARVPLKVTNR
jgi:hypothetical protein